MDDFSNAISIEEFNDSRRYTMVSCDNCEERVGGNHIHIMESFQNPRESLLICNRCYGKLLNGKNKEEV